jgi:hypothetical protein
MQYLRNTNQVQTLDRGITRGNKGVEANIGWKLTESGADANLLIYNNGTPSYPPVNVNTTDSGSVPVFPNALVTTRMTGSNWPVDGPTLMTLIATGSGLTFTTSSYISSSILTTNFVASESLSYGITGSVSYVTASYVTGSCATAFLKVSNFSAFWNYTLCDGTNITGSSAGGLITSSIGNVQWDTISYGGDSTNKSQCFVSPYTSSFVTAAVGNGTSVTFTAPLTGSVSTDPYYLASWIGLNQPYYNFQLLRPGQSLTVCTRFPDQTYFSPGSTPAGAGSGVEAAANRFRRLYITSGSAC